MELWPSILGLLFMANILEAGRDRIFKKTSAYVPEAADDRLYPNLGIVFKEIAKLQPTREVYTIHLVSQLPDLNKMLNEVKTPVGATLLEGCPGMDRKLCEPVRRRLNSLQSFQDRIKEEFQAQIDILAEDIPALNKKKTRDPGRYRRSNRGKAFAMGMVPFVGASLVGAWAHERIDELESKVEVLTNTTTKLVNNQAMLSRGLSTLANVTVTEFGRVHNSINLLQQDIVLLGNFIRSNLDGIASSLRQYSETSNYLERMDTALHEYYTHFGKLLDKFQYMFHELNLGRLPRSLITHSQLQKMLRKARQVIDERYPGYDLVYQDASDYYNVPNVIASIVDFTLIVQIPAYVKQRNQALFTLYRVHAVHVPYSVRTANGLPEAAKTYSYTRAQLGATHFAASVDDYMTLAMELLIDCEKRGGVYICPQIFVHTHRQKVTCLSAVYWGHPFDAIQKKCNYQYFHDVTPEAEIHSNGSHSLLANVGVPWSLICGNKAIPTRESGERYVLIEKRSLCQCALTTDLHYLPATITDCEEPTEGIVLSYPFNAVVQYHYQGTARELFDYTQVSQRVNESDVPSLKLESAEADAQILSDEAKSLPVAMDRVFQMIDSDRETFLTQAEYLQSRTNVKKWFSGKTVIFGIVLVMSVLGVVALLVVICLCYQSGKIKTLASAAALGPMAPLAMLPTARAEDGSVEMTTAEWAAQMALERMYVLVIGFSSLLLYYLARKIFKKCVLYRHMMPAQNSDENVHESQLFLELASPSEAVRIYLTTVRAAAVQILVPNILCPRITNVRKTLCYTNVTLDWNGQMFYIYDTSQPMQFPTIVSVPIYRRRIVERIMQEPYSVRILILQDVYYALDAVRGTAELQQGQDEWSDESGQASPELSIAEQLSRALPDGRSTS